MSKQYKGTKKSAIILLTIVCFILSLFPPIKTEAAGGIKIYNYSTGKTTTYTDKQIKFVCNTSQLALSGTPGILSNGTALGSYQDIYEDFYGFKCTLSEDGSKITISDGSTKIVMTIGSKTAYVNGAKKTLSAAPVKVKYMANNKVKILVPTRFVTEALGMSYRWNSADSTVTMVRTLHLDYDEGSSSYTGTFGRVIYDGRFVNTDKVPVILMSNTAMIPAYSVLRKELGFTYQYNPQNQSLLLKQGDITLNFTIGSSTAYVNGQAVDSLIAPVIVNFKEYNKEVLLVPAYFIAQVFGYDYSWNQTEKTSLFTLTDKVGIWKDSLLYNIMSESDLKNETHVNSMGDLHSFVPEETYLHLISEKLSKEEREKLSNLNKVSIKDGSRSNENSVLTGIYKVPEDIARLGESIHINFSEPVYEVENMGFNENGLLVLKVPSVLCSSRFYNLRGQLISNIATENVKDNTASEIKLKLASEYLGYDIRFSEDHRQLIITAYPNLLTEFLFGRNEEGIDFIKLDTLFPVNAEMLSNKYYFDLTLRYTQNLLGDYNKSGFNGTSLEGIDITATDAGECSIILEKLTSDVVINTEANENGYIIYFTRGQNMQGNNSVISLINKYLDISLPEEISFSQVADTDEYYNHRIVLTLPGRYADFYDINKINNICGMVSGIEVVESAKGYTNIIISTDVVQGYRLEDMGNTLRLHMGRPNEFYDKIVVLDAGHGASDPGAVKNGIKEKDLNFKILNQYTAQYFKNSDIKVYFTRIDDTLINLYDRAAFATEVSADFFVSLHMNSNNSSKVNGTGVYYSLKNNSVSSGGLNSKILAASLAKNLSGTLGTKNNGILTADFVVIRETKVPAVLIELAFMSNAGDLKKLTNGTMQKKAAKTIYDTITSMFEQYPVNR